MRTISLETYLRWLIGLCIFPVLLLAGWFALSLFGMLETLGESTARDRVKSIAAILDAQLEARMRGLGVLAASSHLAGPPQLPEFRSLAQGYLDHYGVHVILADASMQMLVNTRVPEATRLPKLPVPSGGGYAAAPAALATGKPAVGDIVQGPVAGAPLVALAVPVTRDGRATHVLLATIETAQVQEVLGHIALPEGWRLTVRDGKGELMGSQPPAADAGAMAGERRFTQAIGMGRWELALSVSDKARRAPLETAAVALVAALAAMALLSVLAGRLSGRWLERAVGSLARTQARGAPGNLAIAEVEAVRARLAASAESLRLSEARYRTLFDSHHSVMLLVDPADGRIVDANGEAARFYGWPREELLARRIFDINVLSREEISAELDRAVREKRKGFHFRHRLAGGQVRDVSVYSGPVEIEGRTYAYSIVHDETDRLKAEEALRAGEARYHALFRANPQPMWLFDLATLRFLAVNDAAIDHYGYTEAQFLAMTIADIRPPGDVPRLNENIARRRSGETPDFERSGTWRHRKKDGGIIAVEIVSHRIAFEGRDAEAVVAIDVTERLKSEERVREHVERLQKAMTGAVTAISQMMDLRDPYTSGHERRVGELCAAIAAEMGLPEVVQEGLRVAGGLHDVGKITVPAEILVKPGRLTAFEYALVKEHPLRGLEVLQGIDFPWPVAQVAYQHHERLDGSGYPQGLKGEAILLEARIAAVADVVESMASDRPYRARLGIDLALAEIRENAGRLYDPAVAAACLRLFEERGYRLPG